MKTRDQIDQQCWAILADRTPFTGKPQGFERSGRPANFAELADAIEDYGDYEHAWSEFLHEFYRYKTPDFFAVEPPAQFSTERRALLAGVAETLSIRFGLPVPEWTQQSEYTLAEPWDPNAEFYPGMSAEERMEYRSPVSKARTDESLSYLDQAEEFYNSGTQVGGRMSVRPLLLYYSILNLAKCLIAVRNPTLDLSHARHGLTATRPHPRAILGDKIGIRNAPNNVNIFSELMTILDGHAPHLRDLQVRHLLPQILPGHRLWTYACGRKEQFLNINIKGFCDSDRHAAWLRIYADRGELAYLGHGVGSLISSSGLPGQWEQVQPEEADRTVVIEQSREIAYVGRPLDCVTDLFRSIRSSLWSVVTTTGAHRKYYLNCDEGLGNHRLPQWSSVYVLFFYLSDLTRYRPVQFDRLLEGRYGPQIESFLAECPSQFLFLMASELLQREVAPADLA